MRQFDLNMLTEIFRKDQIKSIDNQINELLIEKNKINVQIALLLDKRNQLKKPLAATSDYNI
ncbi:hypothetical protein [Enterococcus cecorum]|uniref:hypothetical protein n=1 Tax=Enterococcus cecorum TaxID=44008 RepID=UPI003F20396F